MKVTVTIDIKPGVRAGTERAEQLRQELWEAIDELTIYDSAGTDYGLTVVTMTE